MQRLLEVKGLKKTYSNFKLDGVSFSIYEDCITGFIGANGAGKTTTIRSILNLISCEAGSIKFKGKDTKKAEKTFKDSIGVVFDEGFFYDELTLTQMKNLIASSYSQWDNGAYTHYLNTFSLKPAQTISSLSRGMKMKFSLALALSHHAELLIMDEPTSGLDPLVRKQFIEILKEYFVSMYYNNRVQTFVFRFLESNFYDPYMIEFLIDNNIINYNGSDYVYIGHQTPIQPVFPIKYKETFFRALEKKDKTNIRKYKTKAMGFAIKNRMSVFYNRPEVYFEITYDAVTKDWGIIPTFFDELLEHIESGELFTEDDGNFYVYNIIIKYFNDQKITTTDLNLIENFDFQQHHMLFYAIPAVIFCLNHKMDELMEKE